MQRRVTVARKEGRVVVDSGALEGIIPAQPRVLHDVFGFAEFTQHAVGMTHEAPALRLEAFRPLVDHAAGDSVRRIATTCPPTLTRTHDLP